MICCFLFFNWSFLRSISSRVVDWHVMDIREYGGLPFWHIRRRERCITEKSNWSSCYSSLLVSYYFALVWHIDWKTHPITRHGIWRRLNSNINRLYVRKINRNWLNNLSDYYSFRRQRMTSRFENIFKLIDRNIISRLSYNMM